MIVRYEVALLHSAKCAVILCCMLIAALSFSARKSFAKALQTASKIGNLYERLIQRPETTPFFGRIEGTVVDPNGKPVEGAYVYVISDTAERDRPQTGRMYEEVTTSGTDGWFLLNRVIAAEKVRIFASKPSDYYEDVGNPFIFHRRRNLKIPEVRVNPGQKVTGVTVRLMPKAGKLHLSVRDADTKELVQPGVFIQWCRKDDPDPPKYCMNWSGPSEEERTMPLEVGVSILIEAEDDLHEKWEYRNPKTGSRYFRAKSGETETANVYLRKKRL
jgi:hypothetical protein